MMNITMPETSRMGPATRIKGRALPCRVLVLPRMMPTMMLLSAMGITEINGSSTRNLPEATMSS